MRKTLLTLWLMLATLLAYSQSTYPVQVQPSITFPSSFLTDYADASNVNVRVYLSDLSKTDYRVLVKIKLVSDKIKVTSTQGLELTLQGGQIYFLNSIELGQLFNTANLSFTSNVGTTFDNSLPEGVYTLSFEVYDAQLLIPVSNSATDFAIFSVNRHDPPTLASPVNKQVFDLQTINQNVFFNWMPRHINYSPSQQVKYRFRLIKVVPVDRNPYDAMNATVSPSAFSLINADNLDFPVFIYTPADLPLEEGSVYAWQVTAYEEVQNGGVLTQSSARFKNLGQSEVFTFSIKENCQPVTPIKAPVIDRNLIVLEWNYDPSHQEYEVAYRPFGTSLPWALVNTTVSRCSLDNSVLQAGVSYEYTVRAKCRNWGEVAYGGTFSLTAPTCTPPSPIVVDNTSSETEMKLSWNSVSSATGYRFQYKNIGDASYTTADLLQDAKTHSLPKLSSGGYEIKIDAVCGTEEAEGTPVMVMHDDNGVAGPCPIPVPFQLISQRINGDTASLSWPSMSVHTGYSITYWHRDSVTTKRTLTSTQPSTRAGKIKDDQLYVYQVTYSCGTKTTTTPQGMFRIEGGSGGVVTDPGTADCFPPTVLQAEARSTTSALFEWNKVDGAEEYQLFYSPKGTNKFVPFNTTSKSASLKDLEDSKEYQYLVRCRCGGKYSIFSDTALVDLAKGRSTGCDSTRFFVSDKQLENDIRICWKYDTTHTGYKISYREEAQSPADEYVETFSDINKLKADHLHTGDTLKYTFNNLKAGTQYVFRIQALCGTNEAMRNSPIKVNTKPDTKSAGECGSSKLCDRTNTTPLQQLSPNDTIYCADYQIKVIEANPENSTTGVYSGKGTMVMPIAGLGDFVTVSVSFDTVKINAKPNSCVYAGTISIDSVNASVLPVEIRDKVKDLEQQITDAIDKTQSTLADIQNGIDQAQDGVQNAIDYFQGGDNTGGVKDGGLGEASTTGDIPKGTTTATVSGTTVTIGGNTVSVSSLPALIKDKDGEIFQVTANGTVTHVGTYDPTLALVNDTTLDLAGGKVEYKENTAARYDFDKWETMYSGKIQVEREYEKIGTDYYVAAKLLLPAETDQVDAVLTGSYSASSIKFANSKGAVFNHTNSGNNFTITVPGGPADDGQFIYAWHVNGTTKKAIGKLLVPSYAPKTRNIVVIPMGEATQKVNASTFETALNKAYQKIGITYRVTVDASFKDNKDWGDGSGKLLPTGSNLFGNNYQGQEAELIKAYVEFKGGESELDPATGYFFAVHEAPKSDEGLVGKMPAEEQFGFLYAGVASPDLLARTVAHEIGHGAYHLEHTYNSIYLGDNSKTKTTNLMDYGAGFDLWKYQWDIVHDPGHVWGILKRDKDAEARSTKYYDLSKYPELLDNDRLSFFTPHGELISLPKEATVGFTGLYTVNNDLYRNLLIGSLYGFTLEGKDYFFNSNVNSYQRCKVVSLVRITQGGKVVDEYSKIEFLESLPMNEKFYESTVKEYKKVCYAIFTNQGLNVYPYDIEDQNYNHIVGMNVGFDDLTFHNKYKDFLMVTPDPVLVDGSLRGDLQNISQICQPHVGKSTIIFAQKIGVLRLLTSEFWDSWTNAFDLWTTDRTKPNAIGIKTFDLNMYNGLARATDDEYVKMWEDLWCLGVKQDHPRFYSEFIKLYRKEFTTACSIFDEISEITGRDYVKGYLSKINENCYQNMSAQARLNIVRNLLQDECSEEEEQYILKTLTLFSSGNQKAMQADVILNGLREKFKMLKVDGGVRTTEEQSTSVLHELIYRTDDETFKIGENNYKALMMALTSICYHSPTFVENLNNFASGSLGDNKVNFYYTSFWKAFGKTMLLGAAFGIAPGTTTAVLYSNDADNTFYDYQTSASRDEDANDVITISTEKLLGAFTVATLPDQGPFDPFAPIIIVNNTMLPTTQGFGYANDEEAEKAYKAYLQQLNNSTNTEEKKYPAFLPLPALVAEYMSVKKDNQIISDASGAVLDAISIASGYGAAIRAATLTARLVAVAEVAEGTLSITAGLYDGAYNGQSTQVGDFLRGTSQVMGFLTFIPTKSAVSDLPDISKTLTYNDAKQFAIDIASPDGGAALLRLKPDDILAYKAANDHLGRGFITSKKASEVTPFLKSHDILNTAGKFHESVKNNTKLFKFSEGVGLMDIPTSVTMGNGKIRTKFKKGKDGNGYSRGTDFFDGDGDVIINTRPPVPPTTGGGSNAVAYTQTQLDNAVAEAKTIIANPDYGFTKKAEVNAVFADVDPSSDQTIASAFALIKGKPVNAKVVVYENTVKERIIFTEPIPATSTTVKTRLEFADVQIVSMIKALAPTTTTSTNTNTNTNTNTGTNTGTSTSTTTSQICEYCVNSKSACDCYSSLSTTYGATYDAILKEICAKNLDDGLAICNKLKINFPTRQFLDDAKVTGSTNANHISKHIGSYSVAMLDTWNYLYSNHSDKAPYARVDIQSLEKFGLLNSTVKAEIVKFTDNETGTSKSTLKEFTVDLDNNSSGTEFTSFTKFVNAKTDFAKGFAGHKQNPVYTVEDYDLLREQVNGNSQISASLRDLVREWIDYSHDIATKKAWFKKGDDFEEYIKLQLQVTSNIAQVYQDLKTKIPDLDDRTIMYQVYFCINGSTACLGEGDYFIADFAFVKIVEDEVTQAEYLDVVIADTKLSEFTSFTSNQNKAQGISSYYVRVPGTLLKGPVIPQFAKDALVVKNGNFVKIFSDGTGVYKGVK